MELRERIARAVSPHLYYEFAEWDVADPLTRKEALAVADDVIETLGLTREEEWVEPRPGSTTKFAPYTAERYATLWGRADDA